MTDAGRVAPADRLVTLPAGVPQLTLGWEAIRWATTFLRHPNGPRAGQRWRFVESQVRFLLWWYALDENGQWLFRRACRRLAKGPIAHETPVATPSGWVKHGDLRPGDAVFASDGSVTTVVDVHPEVIEPCYEIRFRDGESIVCTGSHRWPVHEFVGRSFRVARTTTANEMHRAGVTFERPLTTGRSKATRGGVRRWRTEPSPVLAGEPAEFPVDAYVFGYWLGDGDSDCARITVSVEDLPHLLGQFDAAGIEHGQPKRTGIGAYRVRFGRGTAQAALRAAGVLGSKHIPTRLLRSAPAQRWAMLQGIVDSDGTVAPSGAVEISVMAGRLADDIFDLAVSLGLMPTRKDAAAALAGRVVGTRARIRFAPQLGEAVARLPRKAARTSRGRTHRLPFSRSRTIVSITPVESRPARCITVAHPSHQYLVGTRNVATCNSGKSPFAGLLALVELCAPVRLLDFEPKAPGGVIGRSVDMPLVQIVATAESQTANTMRMVRAFAPKGSRVVREHFLDPGKTKYFKSPEGTLEQITSSYTAAEGGEASFVVADETEHWRPGNNGPELFSTLADNLAKSGSRMLELANSWIPGAQSVAEATWTAWVAQEEGRTRGESRILYDARIAPPNAALRDDDLEPGQMPLTKALEFVYGDCWWQTRNLVSVKERILDPQAKPDESKRKYFNWPTSASDAWTTQQQWSILADAAVVVADGEPIAMFFDGSKTRDATALIGCRMSDGHVFAIDVWEPDPAHDSDDEVSADAVDGKVAAAFEQYEVVGFFGDVREWESFVKVSWPELYADRLLVHAVPTGKSPEPIAWDMRSHVYEFAQACELTEAEIRGSTAERRAFTHDGDSRVGRHVVNARRRMTRFGLVSIAKESADSPKKIDAAVCVVGARMVRRLVLASPAWQKRQRRSAGKGRVIVLS